jgi:hypothetical protein
MVAHLSRQLRRRSKTIGSPSLAQLQMGAIANAGSQLPPSPRHRLVRRGVLQRTTGKRRADCVGAPWRHKFLCAQTGFDSLKGS